MCEDTRHAHAWICSWLILFAWRRGAHASASCDSQITPFIRAQWHPSLRVSPGSCPKKPPIAEWIDRDSRTLRVIVDGWFGFVDFTAVAHTVLADAKARQDAKFHVVVGWRELGLQQDGGIVQLPGVDAGMMKVFQGPNGSMQEQFINVPPMASLYGGMRFHSQTGLQSVYMIYLDQVSRATLRELAPHLNGILKGPGFASFPNFHSVSADAHHSEWALLFGKVPPPDLWIEEECRDLVDHSGRSARLDTEARRGQFLPAVMQQKGLRTAFSATAVSLVAHCMGHRFWDVQAPHLLKIFKPDDDKGSDASCWHGRTALEHTLDWNLEVLSQGPVFLFSHLQAARHRRTNLGRQDETLAAHIAEARSLGATVVIVSPQGPVSPPCEADLAVLAVSTLDASHCMHDRKFSVLDLHRWLIGVTPSALDPLESISHACKAHVVRDASTEVDADENFGNQAPYQKDVCAPSWTPSLETSSIVRTVVPTGVRKYITRLRRRSNTWGVPMAGSMVTIGGKNLSFDEVLFAYDAIFEESRLFMSSTYQGVAFQQDPSDAIALADLIWRVRPDLLIELGTASGGSAIFFADQMQRYNNKSLVLTIDLQSVDRDMTQAEKQACPHCRRASCHPHWHSGNIEALQGHTSDAAVVKRAQDLAQKAHRVMVIHDASHAFDDVLADLAVYAPLVTPGSYIVAQDTKLDRLLGGPMALAAVHTFLDTPVGKNFRIDKTFEYFLFSQHHDGFLKRVS